MLSYLPELPVIQVSEKEKVRRHWILRSLIALVREENYLSKGKHLSEFAEQNFYLPMLDRSKNFGFLTQLELFQLGVCVVPSRVLNHVICEKLSKTYGDLSVCGCFIKKTLFDVETNQLHTSWLLDIDEQRFRWGLILPLRDSGNRIHGLQIYRYPDDQKPFFLKSRLQEIYG